MLSFLSYLPPIFKSDYKKKYLEMQIKERSNEIQDKYHTQLGVLYIENLFELRPRDKEANYEQDPKRDEIKRLRSKLRKFLRNGKSRYDPSTLLGKIKDSWLFEEEIVLYGKENNHT